VQVVHSKTVSARPCAIEIPQNIFAMSDGFGARTLKRKNVKGLALNKPPPRPAVPPETSQQMGSEIDDLAGRTQQLEIGIEYKLDLKREDLEVMKELGSGNGGTVSKVKHIATGTIMARKVSSDRQGKSNAYFDKE
jgi:mitogen-activated protein kinase kinase